MDLRHVVLVVEDEPLVRIALALELEAAGFSVLQASSADTAIAILETNSEIRVVFTDIQMPGTMDGVELARYVRKHWPPTIIVVCSGKVALEQGQLPDDIPFLAKPYDPRTFDRLMRLVGTRIADGGHSQP